MLLFSCMMLAYEGHSQDYLDSLRLAAKHQEDDTLRLDAMLRLSNGLRKLDPTEGKEYGQQALQLSEKLGRRREQGDAFLRMGMCEKYLSNFPESLAMYAQAEAIFRELDDTMGLAHTINGQGIVYKNMGDYERAAELYFACAEIYTQINNVRSQASTYNNIGNLYKNSGDYQLSLDYHRKSLELRKEMGVELEMAYSYHNIANTYGRLGEHDTALYYMLKALDIRRREGAQADLTSTIVGTGLMYLNVKEYALAQEYLMDGLRLSEEAGDRQGVVECLTGLAEMEESKGNVPRAREHLQRGLEIALDIESASILEDLYQMLSTIEAKLGNYTVAYEYLKEHRDISDSLYTLEKQNQISRLQVRFDVAEKERALEAEKAINKEAAEKKLAEDERRKEEDRRREAEDKRKEQFTYGLAIGVFLLAIVALLIWRSNVQSKRANQQLERQQQEILIKNNSLQKANTEIVRQSDEIAQKNKDITDSINYAKKIQRNALPNREILASIFQDSFVLYQPKDIISGDFYWFSRVGNHAIVAVADCTGHGVPGALMSMTGLNLLHQIVSDKNISSPAEALELLDAGIYKALSVTEHTETKDGMDIALCAVNTDTMEMQFAGAARPAVVVSDGLLTTYKGSKNSIGGHLMQGKVFETTTIKLHPGDSVYLFSDGYADQFGGERGKKFKNKALRNLILANQPYSMSEQKRIFSETIENWRGDLEQIDDLCLLGFKV